MNLGSFAGGLASGYMMGEKFKAEREDSKFRKDLLNRDMAMREEDFDFQRKKRAREEVERQENEKLMQSYYGEQKVQDGEETIDDGVGGVIKQPKFKTVAGKRPGEDPMHDLKFRIDAGALMIKRDPSKIKEYFANLTELKDEQTSNDAIAAIYKGDPEAKARLAQKWGFNPNSFQLVQDPKTKRWSATDETGRSVEADNFLAALSVKKAADAVAGETARFRGDQKFEADLDGVKANTRQSNATAASAEAVVKAGVAEAQAGNLRNTGAAAITNARANQDNVTNIKAAQLDQQEFNQLNAQVARMFPVGKDVMGNQTEHPFMPYISSVIGGAAPGERKQAFSGAMQIIAQAKLEAQKEVAKASDPAVMKKLMKNFGVSTPQALETKLVEIGLNRMLSKKNSEQSNGNLGAQ